MIIIFKRVIQNSVGGDVVAALCTDRGNVAKFTFNKEMWFDVGGVVQTV